MKTKPGEDPKKPTREQVRSANQFAKAFALRKRLISGEDTHTGGQVPKFYDIRGNQLPARQLPPGTITNISLVPYYVKELDWDESTNTPYYIDEKTGNLQYVHPDIFRSTRFNPGSGMSLRDVATLRRPM